MRTCVLCLVLFHSVGVLLLNVSTWELNCYKWEGGQVVINFKREIYGRILFTYLILISSNNNYLFRS